MPKAGYVKAKRVAEGLVRFIHRHEVQLEQEVERDRPNDELIGELLGRLERARAELRNVLK